MKRTPRRAARTNAIAGASANNQPMPTLSAQAKSHPLVELVPRSLTGAERKQWGHVRAFRAWLAGGATADDSPGTFAMLDRNCAIQLSAIWKACIETIEYPAALTRNADEAFQLPPLHALFLWIQLGYYPPPELLLALVDTFSQYLDRAGDVDLEEMFLGRKVTGAGNYARRCAAQRRETGRALDILMQQAISGSTVTAAARAVLADRRQRHANDPKNHPKDNIHESDAMKRLRARTRKVRAGNEGQ